MKSQRDAFFDALYELNDDRVWVISADCGAPALDRWRKTDRFINVGIAEQNMVNIAIGLALSGKRPYCYAIVPFLTGRAFDQIRQACMMNLPITFVGIGAGYSYDDSGPTHHGIDDIGIMRVLPNMTILAPFLIDKKIVKPSKSPRYIRLERLPDHLYYHPCALIDGVEHFFTQLVPFEGFNANGVSEIITIEEHLTGGLGSIIAEYITDNNLDIKLTRKYIKEYLYAYGRDNLRKQAKL